MVINNLRDFETSVNKKWEHIEAALNLTETYKEEIRNRIGSGLESVPLTSSETQLVLFGSLARKECTKGSDVDWTLLIDGQTKATHSTIASAIKHVLEDKERAEKSGITLAEPGTTGMFGQMTFSSDLIHYIGGQDDTNHNLSRRSLLLLESTVLENAAGTVYERVVRGIIDQYIDNDSGFAGVSGKDDNIPRFLLNDVIRFWRTMCVDFAYKQKEQQGKKWAIRNIKLRMSRKLIFLKGLLLCFQNFKEIIEPTELKSKIKTDVYNGVLESPLDFITKTLKKTGIPDAYLVELLDAYNNFLGFLNDESFRDHLTKLESERAYQDKDFLIARKNSHDFQDAIRKIFIEHESKLKEFTLKYGVL